MLVRRIKTRELPPAVAKLVAGSLKKGGVVVLPTDTIYGLSCLASRLAAIKKIHRLKKSDSHKPLLVLVSDLAMLKKYVFLSQAQIQKLKKYWQPGQRPTTVILRHRSRLPRALTGLSDGLAVRLPKNEFLIKIIKSVREPLVSTSLNISGQPSLKAVTNLTDYFLKSGGQPDLVIDTGPAKKRRASRLIDLRVGQRPKILRN